MRALMLVHLMSESALNPEPETKKKRGWPKGKPRGSKMGKCKGKGKGKGK